ncbi:unnamed protein product [Alopecurus aequalis]
MCPAFLWLSGTKRLRAKHQKSEDEAIENGLNIVPKRPRRAAACSDFKDKASGLPEEGSLVPVKNPRTEEEGEAVRLTKTGPEDKKPCRKLINFSLRDGDGNLQPFEMSPSDGTVIKALVMPMDDDMEKDKEKGIRCERFGSIKDWAISGYKEGNAVIWLSTELADYKCVKPAISYSSCFDLFSHKARVCVEVYTKLAKSVVRNPLLTQEELLASVVRSINSNKSFNGTVSKDSVTLLGDFIHNQITALDRTADNDDEKLSTLPVLVALADECKFRVESSKLPSNGTLTIKDDQCKDVTENEDGDAKLARLLQEQEEWNMTNKQRGRGTSQNDVYIKISEAEIANDYPLPAYYKSYNPEMDEYIFESDDGTSVDNLPVRILNNWALYNSESRLISLELIPMKSGAENDVVIFGYGFMREDDEDPKEGDENGEPKEIEEEQEENEDYEAEGEDKAEEEHVLRTSASKRSKKPSSNTCEEIEWVGQTVGTTLSGEVLYSCVRVRDLNVAVGGSVTVEDDSGESIMCFVEYMYEKHDGTQMIHGRILQKGSQTVLGNAANDREVFFTYDCLEFEVGYLNESVTVNFQQIPWGHKYRKEHLEANRMERAKTEERKKKGLPVEYICKSLYCPEKGAFFSIHYDKLGTGTGTCSSCEEREASIKAPAGSKKANPESTKVSVRRLYRPDDISSAKSYSSDIREVYYSEDVMSVPVMMIEGKCEVAAKHDLPNSSLPVVIEHAFYCEHLYDPQTGALKQLPSNVKLMTLTRKAPASKKNKGKQICDDEQVGSEKDTENCLATLDIFAGCGGLSEGLQLSGASCTKWAIEYDKPAGQAFGENHPEAAVFVENCNVILKAIMDKCGDVDDCISTSEASERAAKLSDEKIKNLPVPGEVEFINGGPPCQGFSGMNRFNQSPWRKVQCEMILAFLSFAEYFRPRFFLLENVRNFVSFNKGQIFRLTLASLLEMGYQVLDTCYSLSVCPCARAYVLNLDIIGDLPPVENGANKPTIQYGREPVSWFQKKIRNDKLSLSDHISKEMNELNLIRCKHIPKRPGCDWHDLPDEKVKLSTGQMVELIPWCLPNTAKRHNQWKGLYGRLDWEGNFPTSVIDPQPMGKVGMCFHPDQDRIITVRECARSQGFPDGYRFAGNIQSKHRQIGNAVPPPLAYALGRKLKQAINTKL